MKIRIIVVFVQLTSNLLYGQYHDELNKILNEQISNIETQDRIDSLLLKLSTSDITEELADCYHDIASRWYYLRWSQDHRRTHLVNAIQNTQKSLLIKRKLHGIKTCSLNKTLYNLGYFHTKNNEPYEAEKYFKEVIEYGTEYCDVPSRNKVFWSIHQMGNLYFSVGEFYRPISLYQDLINSFQSGRELNLEMKHQLPFLYANLALAYYLTNDEIYWQKLNQTFQSARNYAEKYKLESRVFETNIDQYEGNWLSDIGEYDKAISLHQRVIANLLDIDSINLARALNSIAYSQLKTNQDSAAYTNLIKALQYDPLLDSPYNNLGDYYFKMKDFHKGMEHYNKAIALEIDTDLVIPFDELPTVNQLELTVDKTSLLNHLVTKANAWITWYENEPNPEYLEHALETFELADQLVDLIRFESTEQQSKLYWREKGADLYSKAVEVCYLLELPERAFYFMERNKALLLLEDLGHEEAKRIAGLPLEAAQEEFKLRRQIFLSENDLSEADSEMDSDSLRSAVRIAKTQYEDFIDSLNTVYPDYARYKRKTDITTSEELREKYLSANRQVLHYILNEEAGYGLLNTSDSSILFEIENVVKLNEDLKTYIGLLSSGISDLQKFNQLSHKLYRQLIPAVFTDQLQGNQLLIIPDYNLQRIPFETLVTDLSDPKYLIEETEIGYAYSISLLERQTANKGDLAKNSLALAPVQFGSEDLTPLYYSEAEAIAVNDMFHGDLLLKEQASKSNFAENASGNRIIHLATHADLGKGENPWIAFSDGKMYLNEIYATPAQSEMVVLSACNTSRGDLKPGEGVMSLARGFFYSGAQSVVSSLWPITDKGGREIMRSFYNYLEKGDTKTAAMRKAKLDYLENAEYPELKHPYYWAGFVVLGDNTPLNSSNTVLWLLIGSLLILGIIFFKRRSI